MARYNQFSKYGQSIDAKALNAYDDPEDAIPDELTVDSLDVTGDAQIGGNLSAQQLTPVSLGPYEQDGAVNFNNSSLTNLNVASGTITNVNIKNSNGAFKYLTSGQAGTGYRVQFFGSGNNVFDWNGLKNYLSIKSNTIIDSPTPYHTNSELQIAPQKPNGVLNALVTSVDGTIITGNFSGVTVAKGDYIALADGTNYQIQSADSSGSFLTVSNPGSVSQTGLSETYTVHNAGWYFDTAGNLIGEGYGFLQLPKADTTSTVTAANIGMLRYNQTLTSFEAYGTAGWAPLAYNGLVTSADYTTGMQIQTDPDYPGSNMVRFYNAATNTMTINALGQVTIGSNTSPPNPNVEFYVQKDSLFGSTVTAEALQINHQASISGPLSVGSDLTVSGSGSFGSNLYVSGSSSISGSLSVLDDSYTGGSSSITGGLYIGSNASILGTLSVQRDVIAGGSGTFGGGLFIGSNSSLTGTVSVGQDLFVSQSATISNGLFVGSSATISNNLQVNKSANIASSLTVGSNAFIAGSLNTSLALNVGKYASISGDLATSGNSSVSGSITIGQDAAVKGSATISSGLFVGSSATIAGSLSVQKDLNVSGSGSYGGALSVGSNASIAGTLSVYGETDFFGDLKIHGNITSDGTITSNAQVVTGYSSISGPLALGSDLTMSGSLTVKKSLQVSQAATISGPVYFGSDTLIAGSLSVLKDIFATGSGSFGGKLAVAGDTSLSGQLTVGSDTYIRGSSSVTGSLTVGSTAYLKSDLYVASNSYLSGSGSISGSLTVGSTAYLKSDLYVASNSFVIGSGNIAGSLTVGSTAYLRSDLSVASNTYIAGSGSISGSLTVGSTAYLRSDLSVASNTYIAGSGSISGSLTVGSAAYLRSDLYVASNSYLSGSGSISGSLTVGSTAYLKSDLYVASNSYVSGSGSISGSLTVGSTAYLKSDLYVASNSYLSGFGSISGSLTVGSTAYLKSDLYVASNSYLSGSGSISGSLTVGSTTYLKSDLYVASNTYISGSGSINDSLTVGSTAYLKSDLYVASNTYISGSGNINGSLTVGSAAFLKSDLFISSNTYIHGSSSITGNLDIGSLAYFRGDVLASSNLTVSNSASILSGLFVGSSSTIAGSLTINQALNVLKYASLSSDLSVAGLLSVGSAASFSGNVNIAKDLTVLGSQSLSGDLNVASNASIQGELAVQHDLSILGSASVSQLFYAQNATISNTLSAGIVIANQASISDVLFIHDANVYGTLNVNQSNVVGQQNVSGALIVTGTSSFANDVSISSTLSVSQLSSSYTRSNGIAAQSITTVYIDAGSASISGSLSVSTINSTVISSQDASITNSLIIGGPISASSGSIAGLLHVGSLTIDSGNLNSSTISGQSASLSDNVYVGGTLYSQYGSFTDIYGRNAYFSGTVSGQIGFPSTGSLYGPPNIASLSATDSIADALQKLDISLSKVRTSPSPLPDKNSHNQYLVDVRNYVLDLDVLQIYTACIQGTFGTINNLCITKRPSTKITAPLFDGFTGSLTAHLSSDTIDSTVGSVSLDLLALGMGTSVDFLQIIEKNLFYDDGSSQASLFTYFTCMLQPTYDLSSGSTQYQYRLTHSITGSSNPVKFYIDDSQTPVIHDIEVDLTAMNKHTICGVPSYFSGSGKVNTTISGVIASFYNSKYGLAVLKSNSFPDILENSLPNRPVSSYLSGSTHSISFPFSLDGKKFCKNLSLDIFAYNAVDQCTQMSTVTDITFDSESMSYPNRITSGSGLYPQIYRQDFGLAFDETKSLLDVNELQMLDGYYQVPPSSNYTTSVPIGPDYSDIQNTFPIRYATFYFEIPCCFSNLLIIFEQVQGTGWGSSHALADDLSIQIRVISEEEMSDTGWLDANQYYQTDAFLYSNTAFPCLLSSGTTETLKHVTFGQMRRGAVFVRIGMEAVNNICQKKFKSVRVEQHDFLNSLCICDMANKLLQIEDHLFQAYLAGTNFLVHDVITRPPKFRTIRNFYDANHGIVTCIFSRENVTQENGRIEMQDVPDAYNKTITDHDIQITNKHDIFAHDPNKAGVIYAASVTIEPNTILQPGLSKYSYAIRHSLTGTTNTCTFRIDSPALPTFKSSIRTHISGNVTTFSGISYYGEGAVITFDFIAGGLISYFYNSRIGLAQILSNIFHPILEKNNPNRDVNLFQAFTDINLNLSGYILPGVCCLTNDFDIFLYNCLGTTVKQQFSPTDAILIDSVSYLSSSHVISGFGRCPQICGLDFGAQIDHAQSLMLNQELMLYGNRFQLPFSKDFSVMRPAGPDYTAVLSVCQTRYATFMLDYNKDFYTSDIFIRFSDIAGDGWGFGHHLAIGMSLQVRYFDSDNHLDSGWQNANKFFDIAENQGEESLFKTDKGCLLHSHTTQDTKHIKLQFCPDVVYVRVGFDCSSQFQKSFRDIIVLQHQICPRFDRMLKSISKTLLLNTKLFTATSTRCHDAIYTLTHDDRAQTLPCFFQLRYSNVIICKIFSDDTVLEEDIIDIKSLRPPYVKTSNSLTISLQKNDHFDNIKLTIRPTRSLPVAKAIRYQISNEPCICESVNLRTDTYYIEPVIHPSILTPLFTLSDSIQHISGVPTLTFNTTLTAEFDIADYSTSYFNSKYGPASIDSNVIFFKSARECHQLPRVSDSAHLKIILSSSFQSKKISENILVDLIAYCPDHTDIRTTYPIFIDSQTRIDSLSVESPLRVQSGSGKFPPIDTSGFGTAFRDDQSLLENQELQLYAGKYRLPVNIDFSAKYPSGPDYTTANNISMRYVTFRCDLEQVSNCVLKFFDQEGDGWGNHKVSATGITIQLNITSTTVSSGWLDANAFLNDYHVTFADASPCLLSHGTTVSEKHITFGHQLSGTCFIRIGFHNQLNLSNKFRTIILDTGATVHCFQQLNQNNLASPIALIEHLFPPQSVDASNDAIVKQICQLKSKFQPDWRINLKTCYFQAISIVSAQICDNVITDNYPITNCIRIQNGRRLSAFCDLASKIKLSGTNDIADLMPGVSACSGDLLHVAKISDTESSIYIKPSTSLATGNSGEEYSYLLIDQDLRRSNRLNFRIDDPKKPQSISAISFGLSSSHVFISGVKTFTKNDQISFMFRADGCVSFFVNAQFGIAQIVSGCLPSICEKNQRNVDLSSLHSGSSVDVSLTAPFLDGCYSEKVNVCINLFNSLGTKSINTYDMFPDKTLRLDTKSVPRIQHVQSGRALYPDNQFVDFGSAYDHTVSLVEIPELQLIDGQFRWPVSVDFTQSLPAGSPDYSAISSVFSMRYCTFAFSVDQIVSNIVIKFHDVQGLGWGGTSGNNSLLAQDMTLQIRLISTECDTCWLNANCIFDPCQQFQFLNGQPCLLAASSPSEKHVTFGCAKCQGTLYVRIGLSCPSKSFSDISLLYLF